MLVLTEILVNPNKDIHLTTHKINLQNIKNY